MFEPAKVFIKKLEKYIDYYNNKKIRSRLKRKRVRHNTELFL
ncbi:IS3 family transposase [Phocaeicola coprocola]